MHRYADNHHGGSAYVATIKMKKPIDRNSVCDQWTFGERGTSRYGSSLASATS